MKIVRPKATTQINNSNVPIEANEDFSSKVAGKGYCVVDEADGKTYRVTTQNGILVTTEVV